MPSPKVLRLPESAALSGARPVRALADNAYSAKAHLAMLLKRNIHVVIPGRSDHVANRKRLGRNGGRPVELDKEAYKRRNGIELALT